MAQSHPHSTLPGHRGLGSAWPEVPEVPEVPRPGPLRGGGKLWPGRGRACARTPPPGSPAGRWEGPLPRAGGQAGAADGVQVLSSFIQRVRPGPAVPSAVPGSLHGHSPGSTGPRGPPHWGGDGGAERARPEPPLGALITPRALPVGPQGSHHQLIPDNPEALALGGSRGLFPRVDPGQSTGERGLAWPGGDSGLAS